MEKNNSKIFIPLKVPLIMLKIASMWRINVNYKFVKYLLRFYLIFSAICLGMCSIGLVLKTVHTDDLVDRSEAIDILTLTSSALYKQIFFVKHYEQLRELAEDSRKLLIPKDWLKYVPMLAAAHCLGGFFAISFWWACPILKVIFGVTTLSEMPLPMNIYIAWDQLNGYEFTLIYIICCFGLNLATHIYMAVDTYLFTLVYAASGALLELKDNLINLRSIKYKDQKLTNEARLTALIECVKMHAFIIEFLMKVDLLFRSLIVVDILHAIISLSFAMLQMSESKGILEWSKMVLFVGYCFWHQYLNSFFGQTILNNLDALQHSLEEVPWEESSHSLQTTTLLMMTIALKPIKLSAWRMYFLQYATFAEFVKSMISTYMVLRQLQDESVST